MPTTVLRVSEHEFKGLIREHPGLANAFWLDMLANAEVQREWIVSLGRRAAIERTAHLFCELLLRMRSVGRAGPDGCPLPIRQTDLGEALGLSEVHVNRTLQHLRGLRLIELQDKWLMSSTARTPAWLTRKRIVYKLRATATARPTEARVAFRVSTGAFVPVR